MKSDLFNTATKAEFAAANPILSEGEIGYEVDTKRWKMGNGLNAFNSLTYADNLSTDANGNPIGIVNPNNGKTINSANAKRFRAITLGDSHLNNSFLSYDIVGGSMSSLVVSGGIATITMTSTSFPHYLNVGQSFTLFNNSDLTYTSVLNGCCLKVLSTPSNIIFTFSATYNGKTLADGNYSAQSWYVVLFQTHNLNNSWYNWLNAYLGHKFTTVANYALGGSISSKDIAILPNILAGADFDYAFISTGTNDINNATNLANALVAVDALYTNVKKLLDTFTGIGKTCVITTPPPIGISTNAGANQFRNIALASYRQRLLAYAKTNELVDVVDAFATCIDGNAVQGDFISGYTYQNSSDAVHMSTIGQINVVKQYLAQSQIYKAVAKLFNSPVSILEDTGTYAQTEFNANLQVNGLMTGAVAIDVTAGCTGTKPTGSFVIANIGTSTHTLAGNVTRTALPNSNTANFGKAWTIASTWSGTAGDALTLYMPRCQSVMNTTTGKWYKYSLDVTNLGASMLSLANISIDFNVNNASTFINRNLTVTQSNGLALAQFDKITLQSEAFFIPSGTTLGNTQAIINLVGSATSGSTNVELSSGALRQVLDPSIENA